MRSGAVLGRGRRDPARTRVPKGLVPGLDHCDVDCDRSTFYAFPASSWRSVFAFSDFLPTFKTEVDLCRFLRLPIRLGTNQLYRNSPEARLFVWDWIAMSILEMDAFCGEPPRRSAHAHDPRLQPVSPLHRHVRLCEGPRLRCVCQPPTRARSGLCEHGEKRLAFPRRARRWFIRSDPTGQVR